MFRGRTRRSSTELHNTIAELPHTLCNPVHQQSMYSANIRRFNARLSLFNRESCGGGGGGTSGTGGGGGGGTAGVNDGGGGVTAGVGGGGGGGTAGVGDGGGGSTADVGDVGGGGTAGGDAAGAPSPDGKLAGALAFSTASTSTTKSPRLGSSVAELACLGAEPNPADVAAAPGASPRSRSLCHDVVG